ncbi:hypothetical protein J4E80_005728 [Alternaria sp. BMP 0032]|nr:hypothetical protein J4E80_005728 [Alternaria sp. BMP 0032]
MIILFTRSLLLSYTSRTSSTMSDDPNFKVLTDMWKALLLNNKKLQALTNHLIIQDASKPDVPDLHGIRFELTESQAAEFQKRNFPKVLSTRARESNDSVVKLATVFKLQGSTLRVFGSEDQHAQKLNRNYKKVADALKLDLDESKAAEDPKKDYLVYPRHFVALWGYDKQQALREVPELNAETWAQFQEQVRQDLETHLSIHLTDVMIKDDHIVLNMQNKQEANRLVNRKTVTFDGVVMNTFHWHRKCELDFCYHCFGTDHHIDSCPKKKGPCTCGYCSRDGHSPNGCNHKTKDEEEFRRWGKPASRKRCPNCVQWNMNNPDEQLRTDHAAYDKQCQHPMTLAMRVRVGQYRRFTMHLPPYIVSQVTDFNATDPSEQSDTQSGKKTAGRSDAPNSKTAGTTKLKLAPSTKPTLRVAANSTAKSVPVSATSSSKGKERADPGPEDSVVEIEDPRSFESQHYSGRHGAGPSNYIDDDDDDDDEGLGGNFLADMQNEHEEEQGPMPVSNNPAPQPPKTEEQKATDKAEWDDVFGRGRNVDKPAKPSSANARNSSQPARKKDEATKTKTATTSQTQLPIRPPNPVQASSSSQQRPPPPPRPASTTRAGPSQQQAVVTADASSSSEDEEPSTPTATRPPTPQATSSSATQVPQPQTPPRNNPREKRPNAGQKSRPEGMLPTGEVIEPTPFVPRVKKTKDVGSRRGTRGTKGGIGLLGSRRSSSRRSSSNRGGPDAGPDAGTDAGTDGDGSSAGPGTVVDDAT